MQGRDLSGAFEGAAPLGEERPLYCESLLATKYGANPLQGVVTDRWKYIRTTRPEMYDLIEDPDESEDLAEQRLDQARTLRDRLGRVLAESARGAASESGALMDEAAREAPRITRVPGRREREILGFDPAREDPKDLIPSTGGSPGPWV